MFLYHDIHRRVTSGQNSEKRRWQNVAGFLCQTDDFRRHIGISHHYANPRWTFFQLTANRGWRIGEQIESDRTCNFHLILECFGQRLQPTLAVTVSLVDDID